MTNRRNLVSGFAAGGETAHFFCDPVYYGEPLQPHDNPSSWPRIDCQNLAAAFAVRLAAGLPLGTRAFGEAPNTAPECRRVVLWTPYSDRGLRMAVEGAALANGVDLHGARPHSLKIMSGSRLGFDLRDAINYADAYSDVLIIAHADKAEMFKYNAAPKNAATLVFSEGASNYWSSGDADASYSEWNIISSPPDMPKVDAWLEYSIWYGEKEDRVDATFEIRSFCRNGEVLNGAAMLPPVHSRLPRAA